MEQQKQDTEQLFGAAMQDDRFREMMERIEASNAGQEKYARKQHHMSQITAAASVIILGVVLYTAAILIPKINVTYENIQLVMEDLQVVTSELAEADLNQMITDVDRLVTGSEENINLALEKVNNIDIEGLNKAIQNLSDAVEPFANFFNRFR